MLVFYLPIIVLEVMLEADTTKRKVDDSEAPTLAEPTTTVSGPDILFTF